jgi:Ser/Thr protein kinase RdoA (MazF antagonist)
MTRPAPPIETASLSEQFQAVARTPGIPAGGAFTDLLAQVVGESAFQPHALNNSTGAAGPFQFMKGTWLQMLRDHGKDLGIKPDLLAKIGQDTKGRPVVKDPAALRSMLDLRYDASLSAKVAAHYMEDSRVILKHLIHREPSESELHLTFLLGPTGASQLIKTAAEAPDTPSPDVVGQAASANKPLFHDEKAGRDRTAAEALAFLAAKYKSDKSKVASYLQLAGSAPVPKQRIDG